MTERPAEAFIPPVRGGVQDENVREGPTPTTQGSDDNRGHRAKTGSGVVEGSGAGAGGGGNPEDFDSDPVAGGPVQQGDET